MNIWGEYKIEKDNLEETMKKLQIETNTPMDLNATGTSQHSYDMGEEFEKMIDRHRNRSK